MHTLVAHVHADTALFPDANAVPAAAFELNKFLTVVKLLLYCNRTVSSGAQSLPYGTAW